MEWNVSATTDKRFTFFFCNFITFNFSIYKRFLKFLHLAISFQIKKKIIQVTQITVYLMETMQKDKTKNRLECHYSISIFITK